jgi:hypothetical protein
VEDEYVVESCGINQRYETDWYHIGTLLKAKFSLFLSLKPWKCVDEVYVNTKYSLPDTEVAETNASG